MKKTVALLGSTLATILLVGASCSPAQNASVETKPAEDVGENTNQPTDMANPAENVTGTMTAPSSAMMNSDITLTAEALGNREVKISWTIPDGEVMTEGIHLVRSEKENPEFDGKTYWYQPGPDRHDVTWKNVPTGTQHVRLCIVKDEKCEIYSQDVMVEVK